VRLRARHLREDRLFECYLAEQDGEPLEPPAAEHLTDCPACGARYADLRRFMDTLRADADAELDDVFPAERLRAQQQQIARRIEHLGHAARVISFPGHPPGHPAIVAPTRVATRWVAAAAAAGLFLGIGVGGYLHSSPQRRATAAGALSTLSALGPLGPRNATTAADRGRADNAATAGAAGNTIASAAPAASSPSTASDAVTQTAQAIDQADAFEIHDQFLSEVEVAMQRPHTPELAVLDELTPHVREVSISLR
jgi:anti-sigma factor RsiW